MMNSSFIKGKADSIKKLLLISIHHESKPTQHFIKETEQYQ